MSRISPTISGQSWEYALAQECAVKLNVPIASMAAQNNKAAAFSTLPPLEKNKMTKAAKEVAVFLIAHDQRFNTVNRIEFQCDSTGKQGDVRDILCHSKNHGLIGISAKNRHNDLKHSRLSPTIDFGQLWYNLPCSKQYWSSVNPIFEKLKLKHHEKVPWATLTNKKKDYYQPILRAFVHEVTNHANIPAMFKYLLGKFDYYKVVKENGTVSFQSFNMYGSNQWGRKLKLPTVIESFNIKKAVMGTAVLITNQSWQLSFRIHSGNKLAQPSLKFAISLIGNPHNFSRYEMEFASLKH